jgi:Ca-activated chloride channel family protein
MSSFTFAWFYCVALLLLLPLLGYWEKKWRLEESQLFSSIALSLQSLPRQNQTKARISFPNVFLSLFFVLLVLSLMRPQLVGKPIEIKQKGRNLMLALDLSESMEAQDMSLKGQQVDRLTLAKSVVSDFIDKRAGDRIGLVVFGSEAFLHAPLSFDHPMIKGFVGEALIGFAGSRTAIGDAIGLGVKKLMSVSEGDRILVLLTDGQHNAGLLDPEKASDIAKEQGVKLFIVGIGASRVQVDSFFGPSMVNPSRDLDEAEDSMRAISQKTGGQYFRAKDSTELVKIYEAIDRLFPSDADSRVVIPKKEIFFWPLSCALMLLLLRLFWQRFSALKWGKAND